MLSGLKIIVPVVGFAGATGGIVYATSGSTNNLVSNSSPSSTIVSQAQGQSDHSPLTSNKGKCTLVNPYQKSIFSSWTIQVSKYTVIHCSGISSENSDGNSVNQWTGLFPDSLFEGGIALVLHGQSIDMHMEREANSEDDGGFKVTFTSDKFLHSSLEGESKKGDQFVKDRKTITTVKVKSPKYKTDRDIYLLLNQTI